MACSWYAIGCTGLHHGLEMYCAPDSWPLNFELGKLTCVSLVHLFCAAGVSRQQVQHFTKLSVHLFYAAGVSRRRGGSKTKISFSINLMCGITMRKAYKMNLQNYKNASKFCHPLTFLDCISTRFPYSVLALAIEMKLHHNLLLTLTCYYVKNPAGVHMVEFDMF